MCAVAEIELDPRVEPGLGGPRVHGVRDRPHVLGVAGGGFRCGEHAPQRSRRPNKNAGRAISWECLEDCEAEHTAAGFATAMSTGIRSPPAVRAGRCRLRSGGSVARRTARRRPARRSHAAPAPAQVDLDHSPAAPVPPPARCSSRRFARVSSTWASRSPACRDSCPTMLEVPEPISSPVRVAWPGQSWAGSARTGADNDRRAPVADSRPGRPRARPASQHTCTRPVARRAHRGRGRQLLAPPGHRGPRSPDAELPVALEVAVAFVDRIEEIPDAQQVSLHMPVLELPDRSIGRLSRFRRCRRTPPRRDP